MLGSGLALTAPGNRIQAGGGSIVVNADGSISLTPASGKHVTMASGTLQLPGGTAAAPTLVGGTSGNAAITGLAPVVSGAGAPALIQNGTAVCTASAGTTDGFRLKNSLALSWSSGDPSQSGSDLLLFRDVANILAQRNGANAQTQRWYEIYTDGSNYSHAALAMGSTGMILSTLAAGTGTQRQSVSVQTEANGQMLGIKTLTEVTTILAAATTDTTIQIPTNTIVLAVTVRVTTVIPTAASFTVIGATSGTAFSTAAVAVAAGTTNPGNANCPYNNSVAQAIRITPNVQPADNTGRVRVTIHYLDVTPPTS